MKRSPIVHLIVLACGLLCVRVAVSAQSGNGTDAGQSQNQAQDQDSFNGKAAPDFELKLIGSEGKSLKLSKLKGKAVLLNFWATWCAPCKIEMPGLVELQKKYGQQGLQIVGVAMDSDEKDVTTFAREVGVNYPIVLGTENVADLYGGVDGLPELFFIDRTGKIVSHELGLTGKDKIEDRIKKALGSSEAK